jgi:perosamine synthetase
MDFYTTHIHKNVYSRIKKVLDSTFISEGKVVEEFERSLASRLHLKNPVAVNSGTSALHLALAVAGVKRQDEVILPPQTFVATGLAILMQGAIPVFADIQYETGNIDPKSIKEKITSLTKAIIPVHWAGYPCDLDEINHIAREHNLTVIEDAAHALGADYKGRPIGSISDFTCFSFQAIKHLTTGDGGALCCLNHDDYQNARCRRWFGIDRQNSKLSSLGEREFDIKDLGYKYHLNDYAAALGLENLHEINFIFSRRKQIANHYREELKNVAGLKLLEYKDDRESSCWLFTMLVEKREDFIEKLKENNIPCSVVHLRIDKNSIFGGITPGLVNQEKFNKDQISLPLHSDLSDDDVLFITKVIKNGW